MPKKIIDSLKIDYAIQVIANNPDWNKIWKDESYETFCKIAVNLHKYLGDFAVYKDSSLLRRYVQDNNIEKRLIHLNINDDYNIKALEREEAVEAYFLDKNAYKHKIIYSPSKVEKIEKAK